MTNTASTPSVIDKPPHATRLQTKVSYLSMAPPYPPLDGTLEWPTGIKFNKVESIGLDVYRTLYDAVGRQWHWVNRRHLNDQQLASFVHHPATDIYLLSRDEAAIGYVEVNYKLFPQVEIVFVGLIDSEIGNGLGALMVKNTLQIIQARKPQRIIIQTCTLDHPSALPLYQKLGFKVYHRKQVEIVDF